MNKVTKDCYECGYYIDCKCSNLGECIKDIHNTVTTSSSISISSYTVTAIDPTIDIVSPLRQLPNLFQVEVAPHTGA